MHAEGAAPVAAFFAIGDQAFVMDQMMQNGFRQRVTKCHRAHRRQLAAVLGDSGTRLAHDRFHRAGLGRFRQQVPGPPAKLDRLVIERHVANDGRACLEIDRRRQLAVHHNPCHRLDLHASRLDHLVGLAGGDHAAIDQPVTESRDRVMRLPGLHLVPRPVGVGVGRRMARIAIAFDVKKCRPLARPQDLGLARDGIRHRQRIRTVHRLGMELGRRHAGAYAREPVPCHGLATRLPAHGVKIVGEAEQHRRVSVERRLPQVPELAHAGKIHRFPDQPASGATVAEVGHTDAV